MHLVSRPLMLIAAMSLLPAASALAQNNNPGNSGGVTGSAIATPSYSSQPDASDPALTTGVMPKGATKVPADENPTVRGATGDTVVRGDRSTISGDRRATVEQKTGEFESDGGGSGN